MSQSNFTTYSVRRSDFHDALDKARRLNVKKSDFLGVLLRGFDRLTTQQQLECIPPEQPADGQLAAAS